MFTYHNNPLEVQAPQKQFIFWVDLIRVVATFLVVMVHVSGYLTKVWGQIPVRDWPIFNIYKILVLNASSPNLTGLLEGSTRVPGYAILFGKEDR